MEDFMFSDKSKQHLIAAMSNKDIADDLERRLSVTTPGSEAAAQASLRSYTQSMDKIREYLVVALCLKEAGDEIADRLQKGQAVLEAVANGDETETTPAVAASFEGQVLGMLTDVTIQADVPGVDGNDILLTFDGVDDIDTAIDTWNLANPDNTASLTAGDGSQVPDLGEEIQLADGSDAVFSDADLAPALTAFGFSTDQLSASCVERLVVALADNTAASEFRTHYASFVNAIWALD